MNFNNFGDWCISAKKNKHVSIVIVNALTLTLSLNSNHPLCLRTVSESLMLVCLR